MIYATAADFVAYFGEDEAIELTNLDAPSGATVIAGILAINLELASAEIDDYLPPALRAASANNKRMCLDITRYKLDRNAQREDVRQRYEDVIKRLEDIAKAAKEDEGEPTALDAGYSVTLAFGVSDAPATMYRESATLF